jgi:maltose alpha-D-glucosyltransferase/alpha-amylase
MTTRKKGSLSAPIAYEEIPNEELKLLMGAVTAERVRLLGKRVAKLHLNMIGAEGDADFGPEVFSLHYQRSLFSAYQSKVRRAYQKLNKHYKNIPEHLRKEAEQVWSLKRDVLAVLKQVYKKKIDIAKLRIHGDLSLGQVLFTGRDFVFVDFEGEPSLRYSERRLKRAALEDVASMIRSFHYVAYEGLLNNNQLNSEEKLEMQPWAEKWYHYMSQIFIKAYIIRAESDLLIPPSQEDLKRIIDVFLLERMVIELAQELKGSYRRLQVPLNGIIGIMRRYQ